MVGCENGEGDVDLLVLRKFFPNRATGVMVEVGAARPDYLSIGARFRALAGWRVVAVEPIPEFCAQHRAQGHNVHEYACSDHDADDVPFFVVNSVSEYMGGKVSFESFSSLGIKDQFADLHETMKDTSRTTTILVKVRRLDTILADHETDITEIDVLAIDVEGWELSVMRGLSFDRYRPKVVILENLFNDKAYRTFMRDRGYRLWRVLRPNEVYLESMSPRMRAGAVARRVVTALGREMLAFARAARRIAKPAT